MAMPSQVGYGVTSRPACPEPVEGPGLPPPEQHSGAHADHVVSFALACLEASKGSDNDAPIRALEEITFGGDIEPSGGACHL